MRKFDKIIFLAILGIFTSFAFAGQDDLVQKMTADKSSLTGRIISNLQLAQKNIDMVKNLNIKKDAKKIMGLCVEYEGVLKDVLVDLNSLSLSKESILWILDLLRTSSENHLEILEKTAANSLYWAQDKVYRALKTAKHVNSRAIEMIQVEQDRLKNAQEESSSNKFRFRHRGR
ncbi:MAG: hypothetical protein ABH952_07110 [Candidatus Omnitrophota bacterium]